MTESERHELYRNAWTSYDNGEPKEAIALLNDVISQTTSHKLKSLYLGTLGLFLQESDELDLALSACKEAIELAPKNADALTQIGIVKLKLNDEVAAIDYFERATSIQPTEYNWTFLAKSQLRTAPIAAKLSAENALALNSEWDEARIVLIAAQKAIKAEGH